MPKTEPFTLRLLFRAELGYIGQAISIIGVTVRNSSHVASIQHRRVRSFQKPALLSGHFPDISQFREISEMWLDLMTFLDFSLIRSESGRSSKTRRNRTGIHRLY